MADIHHGATAPDIIIEITPHWRACFRGTKAQLIAEGLIPSDFQWPHRTQSESWEDNRFEYHIRRCRPAGIKGLQNIWAEGDYWALAVTIKGTDFRTHLIKTKTLELAELAGGRKCWDMSVWEKANKAKQDARYMAFRAQVLGDMAPRKRGRKPRNTQEVKP